MGAYANWAKNGGWALTREWALTRDNTVYRKLHIWALIAHVKYTLSFYVTSLKVGARLIVCAAHRASVTPNTSYRSNCEVEHLPYKEFWVAVEFDNRWNTVVTGVDAPSRHFAALISIVPIASSMTSDGFAKVCTSCYLQYCCKCPTMATVYCM